MANYSFENMSATDAANFTTADSLYFLTSNVATLGVTDTPATTGPLTSTAESITLSEGGHTLTFAASALSYASTHGQVIFFNGDTLEVGTDTGADTLSAAAGTAGHGAALYGFGGVDDLTAGAANDTLNGGDGNDVIHGSSDTTDSGGHFTENDYYMGGAGADSIDGGNGNDHIYGNLFSSTAGAADGADTINAGAGNDYVNGNAGADVIHGGADNDRLYGGADNDTITGDDGNDYLQGNKGADSLDGGNGADVLHGGADNDILLGGAGNDQLFGDNGNDNLTGGTGFDWLTGGAGNDTFTFGAGDALDTNVTSATTATDHGLVDTIADFTDGTDHIALGFTVSAVLHTGSGVTFTDASAAETYAQQLLTANAGTHDVAAITVGADTYLFYNDTTGSTINSAIHVVGVTDTAFNVGTGSDFV